MGGLGLIPGLGRSPGEGKGYPLQYSGLENPMDCRVHGVAKSQTRLSDLDFHFPLFKPTQKPDGERNSLMELVLTNFPEHGAENKRVEDKPGQEIRRF